MQSTPKGWKLPLLMFAGLALLFGLWAGLLRLGWNWPSFRPALSMSHGPLMISGFLGTLILLERAVALRKTWAYLGVILCGLGGLLLALRGTESWGPPLVALGSAFLVVIFLVILRQHLALYTGVMAAGAASWLVGNTIWLAGAPVYQVVLWWAAFLVLTISGERLELSRVTRLGSGAYRLFLVASLVLLTGLVVMQFSPGLGWRIASLGFVAIAGWMFSYDLARKTARTSGLPRYIALCLLLGYLWLGIAGLVGFIAGVQYAGLIYDLYLHAILVGFVISMVFGHAPIILPAVLSFTLTYSSLFYLPLGLLHSSLILRVVGDLAMIPALRLWGGLAGAAAIVFFFVLVVGGGINASLRASRQS